MFTEEEIELIPCPFCGGRNAYVLERKGRNGNKNNKTSYAVICDYKKGGCGANGGRRKTALEAKIVWNQRVHLVRTDEGEKHE